MKTSKLAKCGIHSASFCNNKHDAPQCDNCILIKRRDHLYKYVNGYKLKRCPKCGEYKMLHEFKLNSNGYKSWCYSCHKEYARNRHHLVNKSFMIGHKVNGKKVFVKTDNAIQMIKLIREYLINNDERIVEIKRI